MAESWIFSPWRLRGHRERLHLSRAQLGAKVDRRTDAMKGYEYGSIVPSLGIFLMLADSLGISPNDLCRQYSSDVAEYWGGREWPLPPMIPPENP